MCIGSATRRTIGRAWYPCGPLVVNMQVRVPCKRGPCHSFSITWLSNKDHARDTNGKCSAGNSVVARAQQGW
jgi:hypothetical protein